MSLTDEDLAARLRQVTAAHTSDEIHDGSMLVRAMVARRRKRRRTSALGLVALLAVGVSAAVVYVDEEGTSNTHVDVGTTPNATASTSTPTTSTTDGLQPDTSVVRLGPFAVSMPPGFRVERGPQAFDYGPGYPQGADLLVTRPNGARCQVAWLNYVDGVPTPASPTTPVTVTPNDGSAAFTMYHAELSDTDLGAAVTEHDQLSVDCDDIPSATLLASFVRRP